MVAMTGEGLEVLPGAGIGGLDLEQLARCQARQRLLGLEQRQGTWQATGVELIIWLQGHAISRKMTEATEI